MSKNRSIKPVMIAALFACAVTYQIELKASELTSEIANQQPVLITTNEVIEIEPVAEVGTSAIPSSIMDASQLQADENLTSYTNQARIDAKSGTTALTFDAPVSARAISDANQEVYYTLDNEGEVTSLSTKMPKATSENVVTVVDGQVVDSNSAIIRTNGGYEQSFYIYPTLDDLKNEVNGVPISGGGFDGTLVSTVKEDGVYYHLIKISGYQGYVDSGNVQIIPEQLIKSRSYYTSEDGEWVYYSAIDPLTSTEYDKMVIDQTPDSAKVGVKYYSDDDLNYYTTPILTNAEPVNASLSATSYYMNLPFRSESSYTASNYQAYLKAKGKTGSMYYNQTDAFTKAQSLESVNSLLLFSMANHESAYGLSTYARACYNFFGRGAIDSDPDKACQSYSFPTATDGILAQALFLQNGYFDILDWRYSGTNVGNKQGGLNVKYASDVDWGKKIANHAYMIDQYLGGNDQNKYPIISVAGNSLVYNDSSLTSRVLSSGDSGSFSSYNLSQQTGTNNRVNVVAIAEQNNAYLVYVPTAVKNSNSVDCSYTSSMRGSYPNYNGRTNKSVATNTANYSCDYVSFTNNSYWISKTNTTNLNNIAVPPARTSIYEYYSNGKVRYEFIVDPATNQLKNAYGYNSSGQVIAVFEYRPGTVYGNHGANIKNKFIIDPASGTIRYAYGYNTKRQITNVYEYHHGTKFGSHGKQIRYNFYLNPVDGTIRYAYGYNANNRVSAAFEYQRGTTYATRVGKIRYKFYINPLDGTIRYAYGYNRNGQVNTAFEYQKGTKYRTHGGKIRYKFFINPTVGTIRYAYGYDANNRINAAFEYQAGTKYRAHGSKIRFKFFINPQTNNLMYANRYANNQVTIRYNYLPNTVYRQGHGARIASRIYY